MATDRDDTQESRSTRLMDRARRRTNPSSTLALDRGDTDIGTNGAVRQEEQRLLSPAKGVADHRVEVANDVLGGVLRVHLHRETRIPGEEDFPKEYLREKEERL